MTKSQNISRPVFRYCIVNLKKLRNDVSCLVTVTSNGIKRYRGRILSMGIPGITTSDSRLTDIPDSSANSAVVNISLDLIGSSEGGEYLKGLFKDLRRVMIDGAMVKVNISYPNPYTIASIKDKLDAAFALMGVKCTSGLDADLEFARMFPVSVRQVPESFRNKGFASSEQLLEALLGIDNALNSIQCILIFNRDKQFRYALANPSLVTSGAKSFMSTGDVVFVMSVYDPGEESMYASRNIINVGFIEPFESEVAATFFNMLGQKHETFTVANIGANLGWYSILAARTSAGVKVDAFEPAPQSLRLLRNTIAINDLAHIIAVHDVALSDEKGSVDFYVYESNAGGNSVVHFAEGNDKDYGRYEKITVPCDTLDSTYLSMDKKDWPEIIIMDAEGHEQKILDGARELFENGFRPVMLVEFSPALLHLRGECRYHYELVEKYNYQVFAMTDGKIAPMTTQELRKFYDQLSVNNPDSAHLDLLFLPLDKYTTSSGDIQLK